MELSRKVEEEAKKLLDYAKRELADFYERGVEGYIFLRQVKRNGEVLPLSFNIPLTPNKFVKMNIDRGK